MGWSYVADYVRAALRDPDLLGSPAIEAADAEDAELDAQTEADIRDLLDYAKGGA
jgi:hypothetical protein